jgi:uncharacterized protein
MGRFILLVIALFALIWLVRGALGKRRGGHPETPPARAALVRCAHCGVHLPEADARSALGRHFCSEEHLRLGERDE